MREAREAARVLVDSYRVAARQGAARVCAEQYGRMAAVAVHFHVRTGNPAELDAAVIYARTAARYAAEVTR